MMTRPSETNNIKFGPQVGLNVLSQKIGMVAEYSLKDNLGLQSGLLCFQNFYGLKNVEFDDWESAAVKIQAIYLPIHLRFYSGNERKFCWFLGGRLGYIISGRASEVYMEGKAPFEQGNTLGEAFKEIQKDGDKLGDIEKEKLNKFQVGLGCGFGYEYECGIILGASYYKELVNVIKAKESLLSWSFNLDLGYNLAKFFVK